MSKYIVTSDSHFLPHSYEDMIKPLQQMTEVHNAAADAYDTLSMETEALRNYISENEGDARAKAMYDNYVAKLNALQDNLWNRGYSLGTRRDLSAARAAYASDIKRIQDAVKARQERSKEYWDARHNHPELVTGFDPATGGLDPYLDDSEYGRNWFSYNGTQFATEVGADLKARAADLQQSYINKGLGVPGYLEYVIKNGFTNNDINGGAELARRMLAGDTNINRGDYDDIQIMVADVLMNNLQRTGANPAAGGNITPEEYNRLLNFGILGASQSILPDDRKIIDDKVWEQQQKINLEAYKHRLSNPNPQPNEPAVHRELIREQIEAPGAAEAAAQRASIYDTAQYEGGNTIPISLPDGNVIELHNTDEAREALMSEKARKFNEATGLDVTKDASRKKEFKQTGSYKGAPIMAEKAAVWDWLKKGVGIGDTIIKQKVNGRWVYNAGLTEKWNEAERAQRQYNKQVESLNPGKKVSELGLTSQEAQQIRMKNPSIPAGVPDSDLIYVERSMNPVGEYLGVPIVYNNDDDDLRQNLANTIAINVDSKQGQGKTGVNGFYRISDDGYSVGKENVLSGKSGLASVFAVDNDGNIKPESIRAIYVLPQDIKNGKVNVRINTTKGKFMTDISTLGNDLDSAMNPMISELIEKALLPISNAKDVLDVNNPADLNWDNFVYQYLYLSGYNIPIVQRSDGKLYPATAKEVARNPVYQKELLDGLNDYLIDALSFGIDPKSLRPRQHRSSTSDKAVGIYNR